MRTGQNLRRLRTRRGYSLDRLAKVSGVSRAMLGQIETGKSSPTVSILSKVAVALDVSCAVLIADREETSAISMARSKAKILSSSEGRFQTRALFPFESERKVEFYELRISPHHTGERRSPPARDDRESHSHARDGGNHRRQAAALHTGRR
ncbi:helix-turn-helix domain-containing protein [Rhizobium rhizogenes]|uniref:helix-turn-helix domain-containing protein n=1 Tax=Rhizobium rhizogenes TaxID=359 RepID=UPI002868D67F|nr:helix-turn-helix transcriptional regulator [Rhizobium rhizogenes]